MIADTLLINGTNLLSIDGVVVTDFSGVHVDGPYRGENLVVPGMPGAVSYAKVRDAYTFDIGIGMVADDRAGFLTCLNAIRALMPTNLVTLGLTLTGSSWYCTAEYIANTAVNLLNPNTGRTSLEFINLDGAWTSS